jgi:tetratricopeptide (TPR) repeat protein
VYSSLGRLWQVLVGISLVFYVGCQASPPSSSLGNLPQPRLTGAEPEISAPTYFAHGHLLERQGQFDRAAKQYQRALTLDPEHLVARNRLGITLNKLGRHAEASAQFQWALARCPTAAYLHNNLGFSRYLEGKYEEAEAALRRALELKPHFARAHMNHALALARLDRLDEAFAELTQASNEADAHFNMGVILIDAGEYDKAEHHLEAALAIRPNFDAAQQQLREASRLAAEAQTRQAELASGAEDSTDDAGTQLEEAEVADATTETESPPPAEVVVEQADGEEETWVAVVADTPEEADASEPSASTATAEPTDSPAPNVAQVEAASNPTENMIAESAITEGDAVGAETETATDTEPVAWDELEMIWLDYPGFADASDVPPNPPSSEQTQAEVPPLPAEPEIDMALLFAMIDEAIAELQDQNYESFDSLWCRLGYYLFPETTPDTPEAESEWLADQDDIREAATDRPVGK